MAGKFYKGTGCPIVYETIFNCGGPKTCCGSEVAELKPNTTDAAKEKHVPVIKREGNKVIVEVGTVLHPMLENHYIMFIQVVQGNKSQRVDLKPGDAPRAEFLVDDGPVTAYEYCNLHGLWLAQG